MRGSNIVRAVLHLAGASRIADAAKELSDGRTEGDFSEVPAELAAKVLNRAGHEFRHAADGDLSAAEAALEDLLASAPERGTLSHALRGGEALRSYLLDDRGGRRLRTGLLSDDAQRYFDRLLDLTCGFVAVTVHRTDRAGQAERAGIAEILVSTDLLRKAVAEVLELQRTVQQPASSSDLMAAVRLASAAARESAQPEILPSRDRLALLERAVGPLDATSTTPLLILGEGGLGKSVLAGQLFGRFASEDDTTAIFVPCTRIPSSAELVGAAAVDLAFGQAASGVRETAPLTAILAAATTSRVVVIVDTLDLVLTEDNTDDIAYVLRQVARGALLVMTCRDQEWHSFLEPERDLAGALYRLPNLTPDEIGEWADAYAQASAIPQYSRETFAASLTQRLPAASDVFSSPLRLAMACDLYAAAGAVPAGLTVTRLYEAYWERRVARDRRGRRADRAAHQFRTAEALAAAVWAASANRFVEFVPENDAMTGLGRLLSEGTVQDVGGRYAFFHQTYAEFAVARHLAIRGTEADLARLNDGLQAGVPGYWAIAKHLLMLEIDRNRLQELAALVPLDSVEGIRLHFQSAIVHDDASRLEQLAAELKERRPTQLIASVDVLEPATGSCLGPALEVALWCLGNADRSSLPRVALTVGPLIASAESAHQAAALVQAVELCLKRTGGDRRQVGMIVRGLLEHATTAAATGFDLRLLVDRYGKLPDAARAWTLAAVRQLADDPGLKTDLTLRALRLKCPVEAVDDAAGLLIDTWQDSQVQAATGWSDWRSMLGASLPERWNACQLRLMRHLCADRAIAGELLRAAFDPDSSIDRTQYTNAVLDLADDAPDLVAEAVLRVPRTSSNGVLGTLASVASHLTTKVDAGTRLELADSLEGYLPNHPHPIWAVLVKLACDHPARLREYVSGLARFSVEEAGNRMHGRSTVRRAFVALVSSARPAVLQELETELRSLLRSVDAADSDQVGLLLGRLTPISVTAREWVSQQILEGGRPDVALAAAKAAAGSLDDWDREELEQAGLPWLLELLASEQANAVSAVVTAIEQRSGTLRLPATWRPVVVERLVRSLTTGDDQQLQNALTALVAAIDRGTGLRTADAVAILEAHLVAARTAFEHAAAAGSMARSPSYARLLGAIMTLGAAHLGPQQLCDFALRVLTIDSAAAIWREKPQPDKVGIPRTRLANMLICVATKQPVVIPRLEAVWPRCSASDKAAIAECIAGVEAGTNGVVSLRLARRADCPPAVANMLHARFGG
ncbi:hypothetical protein [Kribbella sp. NPDC023855]|uniref:hypothetical protein n=1 Tax=Kribbella sp. NPDC023855 TaxID=3154698 RepID=UPI00340943B7